MANFTDRQKKIISYITNSNAPITSNKICDYIGCSQRTLSNEISIINNEVPLILSNNKGYSINFEKLNEVKMHHNNEVSEEHILLRRLVMVSKSYTFEELARKQYVSESTLDKMLKKINKMLSSFNLSIKREKGYVRIVGNEYSKRKLINHLISEEADPTFTSLESISTLFSSMNITRIKQIIDESIHKYNYYVDKNYSFNLYLNIIIALYRMKSNIYIDIIPNNSIEMDSTEYKIAKEICTNYENHWSISPKSEDVIYVAILLSGQIKPTDANDTSDGSCHEIIKKEFIEQMDNILFETFNYYMISADYKPFLYNFSLHVYAMMQRIKHGQTVKNDLLNNIKKNCPFIYEVAVHVALRISNLYSIDIPDEEIGFISVHIGFLINNSIETYNKIKILLLCDDYHHIGENITEKILSNHRQYVEIIKVDNFDLKDDEYNVDLIITTKPLNIIGKKVVLISPFYTLMDHMQVDEAIHEEITKKEMNYKNTLLSSFFHENLFFKTNKIKTKDGAIKFMANKIIDFGIANKGFTESVFAREKLSSTCFFDTFAIPHSLDMTTKKSMFCVLLSDKGIDWDGKKIHIVLMLAIQLDDRKEFINIYNGIIKALWDNNKINLLIKSNSLMEFISILKQ